MSLLDALLGIREVLSNGVPVASSRSLNFKGDARAAFNPVTGLTDVEVVAGSSAPADTVAATSYTFVIGDLARRKKFTAATAVTATIPPASSVAWPLGAVIYPVQYGAGQVTIAPGVGVTINVPSTFLLRSLEQYSTLVLTYEGSDVWTLGGLLEASDGAEPGGEAPEDVATPLFAWYRGDDVTLVSTKVSSWNDKSGNAHHLLQGTDANRPTIVAADIDLNNQASLSFDGADDFVASAEAASIWTKLHSEDVSIYAVMFPTVVGGTKAILSTTTAVYTNHGLLLAIASSTFYTFNADGASPAHFEANNGTVTANVATYYALRHDVGVSAKVRPLHPSATEATLTRNGSASVTAPAGAMRVGINTGGGQPFQGKIAELIIFDGVLSDVDDAAIRAYLVERYDL